MKKLIQILVVAMVSLTVNSQIIVIDPGHGYGATTANNPDGRTATEIETALAVGLKTRALIQNSCLPWTVRMTRTTNLNSWISVTQRAAMANSWNADRLLSIHCNAGGGTGTETFYCTAEDATTAPDIAFAKKIQTDMVTNGDFNNRRVVEDDSFLGHHLGVLRSSTATACLSEIGFVDNATDAAKLLSNSWRDKFALSYFSSLKSSLNSNDDCCPQNLNLSTTINTGNYKAAGNISASASVANGATVTFNANGDVFLNPGFFVSSALSGDFTASPTGGCSASAKNTDSQMDENLIKSALSEDDMFTLYPNPSGGKLNLDYKISNESILAITIVDMSGKEVKSISDTITSAKDAGTIVIENLNLPKGIYTVLVTSSRRTTSKRVIIQ